MAIQQVYTYAFTVYLKSRLFMGEHIGTQVLAIGATAAAAKAVVQQQFGTDLRLIVGGNQAPGTKPYTTLA